MTGKEITGNWARYRYLRDDLMQYANALSRDMANELYSDAWIAIAEIDRGFNRTIESLYTYGCATMLQKYHVYYWDTKSKYFSKDPGYRRAKRKNVVYVGKYPPKNRTYTNEGI